jgi:hypothetical protein
VEQKLDLLILIFLIKLEGKRNISKVKIEFDQPPSTLWMLGPLIPKSLKISPNSLDCQKNVIKYNVEA